MGDFRGDQVSSPPVWTGHKWPHGSQGANMAGRRERETNRSRDGRSPSQEELTRSHTVPHPSSPRKQRLSI